MQFLVSAMEMAELDRQTIEGLGVPARVLMEVAGRAVAGACQARLPAHGRVAIACGTGNNGGDGFVVARVLAALGHEVTVFLFGERERLKPEARSALQPLEKAGGVPVHVVSDAKASWEFSSYLATADLAVDALVGTGLRDALKGQLAEAVEALNDSRRPVVAVDIPSGVDADTGVAHGPAVQAVATVTFGFAKRGHYLYPGADLRGDLTVADIGIPHQLADRLGVMGRLLLPADLGELLPRRKGSAHKGTFGHVVVVAGSPATPGAALLAVRGALCGGAGLVSWATDEATLQHASDRPAEVMLRVRGKESLEAWVERLLDGATALVIGPGISTEPARRNELTALLAAAQVPLCLDADALNLMGADTSLWKTRAPLVVTPHPKEFARLTRRPVADVQRDRVGVALEFAATRSCVVVLKGAGTVVADPDGGAAVVGAGNPGMATGGTGDVLSGVVGALLAQGLVPAQAARAGALLHAAAGDAAAALHGQAGMLASDLIESLGTVLAASRR